MATEYMDPFRGSFEDGNPRDPGHHFYKNEPMPAERLAKVLTEALEERGVTGYDIQVSVR